MFAWYEEIITGLGATATALLAIWAFARKVLPWIRKKIDKLMNTHQIHVKLDEVIDHLNSLEKEFRPNGGKSLRDRVDDTLRRVVRISEIQKASFASNNQGMFVTDPDGKYEWVNRSFCRLTGLTPSELVGTGWLNAVAQEERDQVEKLWERSIQDEREFDRELKFTRTTVHVHTYKMVDPDGHLLGFYGVITDI